LPELLALIEKTLKPAGRFYLLLPFKRKEEIIEHVNKTGLRILHKAFMKQTISHEPFRLMLSGSVGQEEEAGKTIEEIIIKNEKGAYTPGFVNYLREYYLHL
jgi:tRNA1Val (adenine37-N6)-methyltransferase